MCLGRFLRVSEQIPGGLSGVALELRLAARCLVLVYQTHWFDLTKFARSELDANRPRVVGHCQHWLREQSTLSAKIQQFANVKLNWNL